MNGIENDVRKENVRVNEINKQKIIDVIRSEVSLSCVVVFL